MKVQPLATRNPLCISSHLCRRSEALALDPFSSRRWRNSLGQWSPRERFAAPGHIGGGAFAGPRRPAGPQARLPLALSGEAEKCSPPAAICQPRTSWVQPPFPQRLVPPPRQAA